MGLANYYRSLVEGLSYIASALTTLTQKKLKFIWFKAHDNSFQQLKDRLPLAFGVALSDGTNGFVVYCDASRIIGLGCVLMQNGKLFDLRSGISGSGFCLKDLEVLFVW